MYDYIDSSIYYLICAVFFIIIAIYCFTSSSILKKHKNTLQKLDEEAAILKQNIKKLGNPVGKSFAEIKSILGNKFSESRGMNPDGTTYVTRRWNPNENCNIHLVFDQNNQCIRVEKCVA